MDKNGKSEQLCHAQHQVLENTTKLEEAEELFCMPFLRSLISSRLKYYHDQYNRNGKKQELISSCGQVDTVICPCYL